MVQVPPPALIRLIPLITSRPPTLPVTENGEESLIPFDLSRGVGGVKGCSATSGSLELEAVLK